MGWIGNLFLILGIWYTGKKKWWAPVLTCMGELFWIQAGWYKSQWDIFVLSIIFFILSLKNSYQWYKTKNEISQPK